MTGWSALGSRVNRRPLPPTSGRVSPRVVTFGTAASASHSGQRSPKRRRTALDQRRPQLTQTLVGIAEGLTEVGYQRAALHDAVQLRTNERCK
jgi:hypothetical protein